ncbi:MAG: septum formation protein Maf [Rhodovulum sp.]|jgi:septum formation protein|nr:septum formation protein Maf [Rhodovulum sp.]MEC8631749.1 Maf family nucleotide pyrophosphatase [Pseudomonadota bacterium]|tara:strand:+ start:3033 stop:3632 length:600 start_codon:yes stop_codon:yes gene_type:complete
MTKPIILASGSSIRRELLENAGVPVSVMPARIDEDAIRQSLEAEDATPRDVADTLAEFKARKISDKNPGALVIGCDQVLEFKGQVMTKAPDVAAARAQLKKLRGNQHKLMSAAVLYDDGKPVWRHVGETRLRMRPFSDAYLDDYLDRNWASVQSAVGCYKLEEEGVRLFSRIEGDYFNVLGLPLLELLNHLTVTGTLTA